MVKSKKMSKTSIAVIILALLLVLSMVLGLTGAWFTKSNSGDNSLDTNNSLKFGKLGPVTISIASSEWSDAEGEAPKQADGTTARTVFMPGDNLESGDITISYDPAESVGTEQKVYYLVSDGTNYLKVAGDPAKFVAAEGAAGEITKATPITVSGDNITLIINGKYYCLDSSVTGGSGLANDPYGSKEIPSVVAGTSDVTVEDTLLSAYEGVVNGAAFQFGSGNTTYYVAIVQYENVADNAEAYEVLEDIIQDLLA